VNNLTANLIIFSTDWLSSHILDNPYLFNHVRRLLAGDQRETKQFVREALAKYKCKSVLDLGCGTGDFSESCPADATYLGTDLNANFIRYAQSRYRSDRNKQFRYENILKQDNHHAYDAVLFISMMHHFSDADVATILKKIKQLTRKIVVIADIIPDPPHVLQRAVARLDRGRFVRPRQGKLAILQKYFRICETKSINSRLAVQYGVICKN
jgi:2-polyprenyl-3-methyl-5-hydroxy-6-metoxy-1,4-benzoquinol methylase